MGIANQLGRQDRALTRGDLNIANKSSVSVRTDNKMHCQLEEIQDYL